MAGNILVWHKLALFGAAFLEQGEQMSTKKQQMFSVSVEIDKSGYISTNKIWRVMCNVNMQIRLRWYFYQGK